MSHPNAKSSVTPPNRDGMKIYGAGLLVCAALTGVAYYAGVEPVLEKHQLHQANLAELEAARVKSEDLGKALLRSRRELVDARFEVTRLPLRLESALVVNHRLARLADLAAESGLRVDELHPGTPQDHPYYQTVPLRMLGTGTYPQCAAFLHGLRERFPDMGVKGFECSNPRPGGGDTTGAFRFELTWYTAPAAANPVARVE